MDISRKILAPPLPPTFLHREQLSQILYEALNPCTHASALSPYRLVLLCTPAGYGKTTLLVDTIQKTSLPCCWLNLDLSDKHPSAFLTALLASLCQQFPNLDSQVNILLRDHTMQDEEAFRLVMETLLDTLETTIEGYWLLCFCNYHEVNDSAPIKDLVNRLLKHLPTQCLLVIESRAVPDLELASLIAHHQLFGLGAESLRFSVQEVCTLAQIQNLPAFSEEEAAQVVTTFDGWITGMLLASRLGATSFEAFSFASEPAQIPTFTDRRHLSEFMLTEVFHEELTIYALLKETSFLDHLAPAFCDMFRKTSNAALLLERAERQGLFVGCTYENGQRVYRCSPILRELFLEELHQYEPETARILHQRLATAYYQTHAYPSALTNALEAQAYELIAEIVLEVSQTLLEQGYSDLILRGIKSLPAQIMEDAPRLLLIQANIYLRRGDAANARCCFEQAQHLVPLLANSEQALTRAELAIVQGKLFLQQGNHHLAGERFQEALEWLPIHERKLRLLAHQQYGICHIVSGRPIHESIAHFQQALQLCQGQDDAEIAGELHHQLANVYTWIGNYTVAEHHRHYVHVLQDRLGQPHKIMNNLIGFGFLKIRQGLVEEAETAFQSTLELTQKSSRFLSSYAYALLGLGEVALIRQDALLALRYGQEALDIAHQLEDHYLLNDVLGTLALTYLQLNERYTARALLEQMVVRTEKAPSYENVFQQLVSGTILLAEQSYDKAGEMLEQVARLAGESGIQWLQVQALLRLAVCRIAQDRLIHAKDALQHVRTLNTQGNHDACIQVEAEVYPPLHSLLQEKEASEDHLQISIPPSERLCIHALGEPVVLLNDRSMTGWRRARALELFFFLLESKQPLRKEKIITALWPESDEDEILNQTFRSTVYCIRQVLDEACLVYQSGLYQLNLQAVYGRVWYDVAVFEEEERAAKAALKEEDDVQAEQAYTKMIDLYRGKYAEAFYSDWCNARRDTLHQSLMEARRQLALIAWRRDAWEESLQHWQYLLTLDPCLETAHSGIMRCYARQGKRDLALRQYQRCCRELHEQMGIEPDPSLQKLYQRLTNPQ